jgi:23S rRNA (adenine2503-C2)-methyltransferase
MIESVLMQEGNRITVCLSSQVGCAMDCDFCATAKMGFQKNLSVGEIVDQFLFLQQESKKKITNVVFMGMGEPFLNYARVIKAADLLNQSDGIDLGARRITISTVGIIPRIKQFSKEGHRYKLAISLNGTTQNQRLQTMPAAKKYPIHKLIDAAKNYYETAKRFPTFEYVLMNNLNDRTTDAENLIKLIGNLPCKVNLIPYNEIGGTYKRPSHDRLTRFINALKNVPFTVTVRWSNGTEIDAGCGQLAVNAGGSVQS